MDAGRAGRRWGTIGMAAAWLAAAAAATVGVSGCERVESRIVERAAKRGLEANHDAWLDDGSLHVVLCGTGSPLPSAKRAGPCTAVIAGGHFLLVDVGPGSWNHIGLWHLPAAALDGVLLTHFHSDHIAELGEAAMQSWALGRPAPLRVIGPPGVERVVAGFEEAYAQDTGYRVAHHGADLMPPATRPLQAVPVAMPESGGTGVFDEGGLRVTMFRVDHAPVRPAVGYRFDFGGRSVVVSGDTARSDEVARQARGADVLVHEALAAHLVGVGRDVAAEAGDARRARILGDIPEYHTTPVEAAEIAKAAGVKRLVLTHLVPPPDNVVVERLFLRGVAEAWDGEVILGEDGLHLTLPGGSEEIRIESLD